MFIVAHIEGVCNCSMFCCTLLHVHSSFAIILMGTRELVAMLKLSSCCLVIVVWLFLVVSWVCLQCVIVVFPVPTHYFFFHIISSRSDSLTRSERDFVLGSHLLLVYLNSPVMFNNYLQLTTSADNIFRWILSWRFKG